MYKKEQILDAVNRCLQEKGTRKFTQSLELAINFRDVDLSKPENKLNLDVPLPKGRGKDVKVAVFADGETAAAAKAAGADMIMGSDEIAKADRGKLKKMAGSWEFLAQPQLMMLVGKNFGQLLGGRGKLPRPVAGNIAPVIKNLRNVTRVRVRGRNLPTVHCAVGTESMSAEDLAENVAAVLGAVNGKLGEHVISSVYLKLSMGKSQRIGV